MTPARFAALAAAYGSDIERWPTDERLSARAYRSEHADAAGVLAAETGLDRVLERWTVPGPGAALAASIAAAALRRRFRMRRLRLWLSGVGAVATLSGGVAAGMALMTLPNPTPDSGLSALYGLQVLGEPLDLGQAAPEPKQ